MSSTAGGSSSNLDHSGVVMRAPHEGDGKPPPLTPQNMSDPKVKTVFLNDQRRNAALRFADNYISTTKYSLITFLPKNLFHQFKRFANLYYLFVSILSTIPILWDNWFGNVAPLVFVLAVSAVKEAIEDYRRYRSDQTENRRLVEAAVDGTFESIMWKDVKVGMIVRIHNKSPIPADMVVISTSEPGGRCYIETANLDGETNSKLREAVHDTSHVRSADEVSALGGYLQCGPPFINGVPQIDLYKFDGALTLAGRAGGPISLSVDNVLLRGSMLRNTESVLGLVISTGRETKLMLNSAQSPLKRSNVERLMNYLLYLIFGFDMLLCFVAGIGAGVWAQQRSGTLWYLADAIKQPSVDGVLTALTSIIAFSFIIPISLYVSIEIVKLSQTYFMNSDLGMYYDETDTPCNARTSNLNEELGQIKYVFTDKTGTLTCNKMEFMRCSVAGTIYGASLLDNGGDNGGNGEPVTGSGVAIAWGNGHSSSSSRTARDNSEDESSSGSNRRRRVEGAELSTSITTATPQASTSGPIYSASPATTAGVGQTVTGGSSANWAGSSTSGDSSGRNGATHRFQDSRLIERCLSGEPDAAIIAEFLRVMAVCHNIIPEREGDEIIYNAQSPDEAALAKAAKELGFSFESRGPNSVTISVMGVKETFHVLNILEFNSNRKRMSVVVRTESGRIFLYCKGADNVILPRLSAASDYVQETTAHLETFATEGLRTLCLAARELTEDEWREWNVQFEAARTSIGDREEKTEAAAEVVETDLILLGATAIEDRLQDGVPETIQQLYRANIKVWMLTGDKQETAINIGFSCRMLYPGMRTTILNQRTAEDVRGAIETELAALQANPSLRSGGMAVIVDGAALSFALTDDLKYPLLKLADQCEGVICCRVSPKQKALVVALVKNNVKGVITLSIGDGANDVPMIQEAHVGVGISGLEGMQAVMASDYAISQFRFLERLLLVHGRYSYKRIARLILYSFHKNLLFTLPQVIYYCYTGFSGTTLYQSQAGSLFNVLFSTLPILALGIFEADVPSTAVLQYPQLYVSTQQGRSFNMRRHIWWSISAIVQAILVFFPLIAVFGSHVAPVGSTDGLYCMGAVAYCAVVFCVNFKIIQMAANWNWIIVFCVILTLFIWFPFMALAPVFESIFGDLTGVLTQILQLPSFYLFVAYCVVICSYLDYAFKAWVRNYDPAPFHIVQELSKLPSYSPQRA